ncbi:flagella synthesis protein FlgN [Denitrificimonas caeni]|uniref:flagella synthesis protein FlgN n=1 Tax=Denitrificimonas caeni TaxID=521720 RepID=UPI0003B33813|nr:flagellar protein FlgN [Denitrificimonas caeni]
MADKRIVEILLSDISIATQLLEILDQEFTALSDRKLDVLQDLLAQKQPYLRQLEQHSKERSQLLTQALLSADQQGIEQLASNSPVGSQLLENSASLNSLLEQCQTKNLRNGRLIRSNQISINSMLNIIRGTDTPSLYDKKGSTSPSVKQRPFSQA